MHIKICKQNIEHLALRMIKSMMENVNVASFIRVRQLTVRKLHMGIYIDLIGKIFLLIRAHFCDVSRDEKWVTFFIDKNSIHVSIQWL